MTGIALDLPPGVAPLAAFLALILAAYPVYRRLRPVAWLVPMAALVAATLAAVDLPDGLRELGLGEPTVPWTRTILIVVLAVVVAKLLLLHRHATRVVRWGGGTSAPQLLPSQQLALDGLKALIADQARKGVGQVLPLDGRPGDGKSLLLTRLKEDSDQERPVRQAVVLVDVWQHQTETDLQAAILEEVYSHPEYQRHLRWLRVPVSFFAARQLAWLRRFRSTVQLKFASGMQTGLELDLEVPQLRWQRHFEQATARMASRGVRTVIVLDELDRAVPAVTQAALTLARRSVDVRGVTVVLAYVRAQVRYKAFNPLLSALPDLASSMEAILYEHHHRAGQPERPEDGGSILGSWQALYEVPAAKAAGFLSANGEAGKRVPDRARDPGGDCPEWLRLGVFGQADRVVREQLQERFEEKYLGAPALRLGGVAPDDVAHMVTDFGSARRLLERLTGSAGPQRPDEAEIRASVARGVARWREAVRRDGWEVSPPPIRVLEGYLYRALESAAAVQGRDGPPLAAPDVAALVVGAYYVAALIYGGGGADRGRQ